ncbi:MAG TPA: ammonia-forming cytochrome c nitrite reductase subunit c552 [Phycisphaerales bacterium]|nr:ammonia-forming cytochrome c nitrite reductase subunit c552 [Phycisphaerales bacterium]
MAEEVSRKKRLVIMGLVLAVAAITTLAVTFTLVTMFEHKQESRRPFVRVVDVNEVSTDPAPWGANWPRQFDTYRRTVDDSETQFGGSSAMPMSKLESHPWLKRLYAGYAFSIDYREARGHAYMLYDQEVTERVVKKPQVGACLHCHASATTTWRRIGLESMGQTADANALAAGFNWPAVMEGFKKLSLMEYSAAHAELFKTPDGSGPGAGSSSGGAPTFPGGQPVTTPATKSGPVPAPDAHHIGDAHPVSCIDCHDPQSMHLRVTRPGFVIGIANLAKSDDPVPHLPSVERWRKGSKSKDYDPNTDATRQEMRSFVCGQCHVEYYCGPKEVLLFPWHNGLKAGQIEAFYDQHKFPDGTPFYDYAHGETGAHVLKAQHPEFELWSQGVHARSGVACADCHMPYERTGAMKVSSHWVRSPLLNINNACQTCHNVPEAELRDKVAAIQNRTNHLMEVAAKAMTEMLDAIREAKAAGASDQALAPIYDLQKRAMWRLDFIQSENSAGFHADQEASTILGESIEFSRQAQAAALKLRAPAPPPVNIPVQPVQGVSDPKNQQPAAQPTKQPSAPGG